MRRRRDLPALLGRRLIRLWTELDASASAGLPVHRPGEVNESILKLRQFFKAETLNRDTVQSRHRI